MPITGAIKQGDIFFCEPDPLDTVGGEIEKDRPWMVMSIPPLHRGKCLVSLPLSRHLEKAGSHLIKIPHSQITMTEGDENIDRVALTDQIRALDKTRLRRRMGYVSSRGIDAIQLGLDYLFGVRR
jgi:mRNA-degrading endonuclease toxin of MazEF toxin-antitoxin module